MLKKLKIYINDFSHFEFERSETMPLIPSIIEKSQRGERVYDIYSRLLEERIIFLAGPINDMVANLVIAEILLLASKDSVRDIKHLTSNI